MASISDELHSSLRREASKLLEEAARMVEPSKRRPHLIRAFALVQQAETCCNTLREDSPASAASLAPAEQMARQAGQLGQRAPAPAKRH